MSEHLMAGAYSVDITPENSQFLYGYPNVRRYSTGVNDALQSCALYLCDGTTRILFIANDLVYVSKELVRRVREKISKSTGILPANIMITAIHTHSGPVTVTKIGQEYDSVVPLPDAAYLETLINNMTSAATLAVKNAVPAEIGFSVANVRGVGTNRRNPDGPSNPSVPVIMLRNALTKKIISLMLACSMHPTVLHEDSTLYSADFPGYCREYLKAHVTGGAPIIYHTGPAGNQSPRYVTRGNTFAEAKRIGEILATVVQAATLNLEFESAIKIRVLQDSVILPLNTFPSVDEATAKEKKAFDKFQSLKSESTHNPRTRSAECDWFGAQRRLVLAKMSAAGTLQASANERLPAEIQVFKIGRYAFAGWPGEIFVEYGLEVMSAYKNTFPIAYANGETQGYFVTKQAADEGGYEAATAIFKSPESPQIIVMRTLELLNKIMQD